MYSQLNYYNHLSNRNKFSFLVRQFFIKDIVRHFDGQVLDVGCGIGEFLERYPDSIGIDLNPYALKFNLQRAKIRCLSNLQYLPIRDNSFDGVLLSNILEHLHDAEFALAEALRVLKPQGVLVLTLPMEAGFHHDPTHIRMFNETNLKTLAQNFALEIKSIYRYPFRPAWIGKYLYFCELRCIFIKKAK